MDSPLAKIQRARATQMRNSDLDVRSSAGQRSLALFHQSFRDVVPISRSLMLRRIDKRDKYLKQMIDFALDGQTHSEYPFIFIYAYCRSENDIERVRMLAAAIHLLQSSAFIVDDVIDSARNRYHRKTVHHEYNVSLAIVCAGLFKSVALETISSELSSGGFSNQDAALTILNEITTDAYIGEYLDVHNSADPDVTIRDYYRMIGMTSAQFFARIAKCGGLLAKKPAPTVNRLARYGYYYGMAAQITDDIVDIVMTPRQTGKSFAVDLRCRRMRLPVIHALRLANKTEVRILRDFLKGGNPSNTSIQRAATLIEQCNALNVCKTVARRFAYKALKSISSLGPSLTKETLAWLPARLLSTAVLRQS